jgi:hypothetical protein
MLKSILKALWTINTNQMQNLSGGLIENGPALRRVDVYFTPVTTSWSICIQTNPRRRLENKVSSDYGWMYRFDSIQVGSRWRRLYLQAIFFKWKDVQHITREWTKSTVEIPSGICRWSCCTGRWCCRSHYWWSSWTSNSCGCTDSQVRRFWRNKISILPSILRPSSSRVGLSRLIFASPLHRDKLKKWNCFPVV